MKKFLLTLAIVAAFVTANAQTTTYLDFNAEDYPIILPFANSTLEVVDNPDNSVYGTAQVGQITKGTNVWDGVQFFSGGKFEYAGTDSTFYVWFFANDTQTVRMGQQNYPNWGNSCQSMVKYTSPGEWQKLEFKMECARDNEFLTWTLVTDHFGSLGGGNVVYIDSLTSEVGWTPVENTVRASVNDKGKTGNSFTAKILETDENIDLVDDGTNGDKVADDDIYSAIINVTPYYYTDGQTPADPRTVVVYADGEGKDTASVDTYGSLDTLELSVLYVVATNPETQIPMIGTAPVIDGEITAGDPWEDLPVNFLRNYIWGGSDAVAYWQACWDFENIYVMVTVEDPFLYGDNATVYENDISELYFDMDNSKGESYDGIDDWQLRYNWNNETWTGSAENLESIFVNSERAQSTEEGSPNIVRYEWKLDWLELANGGSFIAIQTARFGFDVSVGDVPQGATNRTKILTWNYSVDEAYQNPSIFGTLQLVTVLSTDEEIFSELQIMPNPANDVLYIANAFNASNLTICNALGAIVYASTDLIPSMHSIDVSNLDCGLYFVTVQTNTGISKTFKVIIQ